MIKKLEREIQNLSDSIICLQSHERKWLLLLSVFIGLQNIIIHNNSIQYIYKKKKKIKTRHCTYYLIFWFLQYLLCSGTNYFMSRHKLLFSNFTYTASSRCYSDTLNLLIISDEFKVYLLEYKWKEESY